MEAGIYVTKDLSLNMDGERTKVEYLGEGITPYHFKGKLLNRFSMHMEKGHIGDSWVKEQFELIKP